MYETKMEKRKDNSLGEYQENKLLTQEVVDRIMEEHCLELKKIHKNTYFTYNKKRIEFDVLIEALTPSGQLRWISVELKEQDVSKVINQAIVRRDFADYSYVVLNNPVSWIVQYIVYVWNEWIKEHQIGFFSNNIFVLNSKWIKPKIKIKMEDK
jgi:hypothetical protein